MKNEMEEQLQSLDGVDRCIVSRSDGIPIEYTGEWSTLFQIYNTSYASFVLYDIITNLHEESFQYAIIENSESTQIIVPIQLLNGKDRGLKLILCGIANKSVKLRELIANSLKCAKVIERIATSENVQPSKLTINDYDPLKFIKLLKCNSKKLSKTINDVREMEKIYFLRGYSEHVNLEFEELTKKIVESIPCLKSLVVALKNGFVVKKYGTECFVRENDIDSLSEKVRLFLIVANNHSFLNDGTKLTSCFIEYNSFYHYIYNLSRCRVDFVLEKMKVKAKFFELVLEEYEINSMKLEKFAEKINSLVKYAQMPFGNLKRFQKNIDDKEKSIIKVL